MLLGKKSSVGGTGAAGMRADWLIYVSNPASGFLAGPIHFPTAARIHSLLGRRSVGAVQTRYEVEKPFAHLFSCNWRVLDLANQLHIYGYRFNFDEAARPADEVIRHGIPPLPF